MKRKPALERLLLEADKAELGGDWTLSVKLLEQALTAEPTEPLLLRLGDLECKKGRFRQAIKRFDAAILENPNRALSYILKAQCLITLKNYEEAQKTLRRSLAIEKRPDAFVQIGSVYEKLGDSKSAARSYQAALNVDPQYEEAHYNRGRLLRRSNPQKALLHLHAAISIDPKYALAYSELGGLLLQLKRYKEAEGVLREAISLDSYSFWNHLYLANLLWKLGRLEEAKDEYRMAERLDRSSFSARCFAKFLKSIKSSQ